MHQTMRTIRSHYQIRSRSSTYIYDREFPSFFDPPLYVSVDPANVRGMNTYEIFADTVALLWNIADATGSTTSRIAAEAAEWRLSLAAEIEERKI